MGKARAGRSDERGLKHILRHIEDEDRTRKQPSRGDPEGEERGQHSVPVRRPLFQRRPLSVPVRVQFDCAKVEDPALNSQAAEQLWGRLDHLHFATEYSRARYRLFFKEYFVWRNGFLRAASNVDVNPCVSRRGLIRHR